MADPSSYYDGPEGAKRRRAELKATFERYYDSDHSGSIDAHEIEAAFSRLHIGPNTVKRVMSQVDFNNDGQISFEEFEAFVFAHEEQLKAGFKLFSGGKDVINAAGIRGVLSRSFISLSLALSCSLLLSRALAFLPLHQTIMCWCRNQLHASNARIEEIVKTMSRVKGCSSGEVHYSDFVAAFALLDPADMFESLDEDHAM